MTEDFLQSAQGRKLERRFRALSQELAGLGWLTNGSVTPNHPGHWRWTRKIKARTVTVALSQEQAVLFKNAIANHRKLELILHEMRAISQEVLLKSAAAIPRKSVKKRFAKPLQNPA
jgi:hypothetical protein